MGGLRERETEDRVSDAETRQNALRQARRHIKAANIATDLPVVILAALAVLLWFESRFHPLAASSKMEPGPPNYEFSRAIRKPKRRLVEIMGRNSLLQLALKTPGVGRNPISWLLKELRSKMRAVSAGFHLLSGHFHDDFGSRPAHSGPVRHRFGSLIFVDRLEAQRDPTIRAAVSGRDQRSAQP
jgi:hypothetical protein